MIHLQLKNVTGCKTDNMEEIFENCEQWTATFITITRQRNILLPIYLPLPKNRTPVIYVMFLNEHKWVST